MLIKMKESKGFTLVELMIVVAIIGILAAVAVPYYQRYVAKSRLTSLVMPAVHSIETNISTYYAVRGSGLPQVAELTGFQGDADMKFFTLDSASWAADQKLKVTINATATMSGGRTPFSAIKASQNWFNMVAADPDKGTANAGQKLYWSYDGPLATELGL